MEKQAILFTNRDLRAMIVPLFLEQFLMTLVGIADVFVVGFVGEAAVSGVSLVNAFNTIFLNLFTALASGGAVVISQYIGHQKPERAGAAASQLLTASVLLSTVLAGFVLVTNETLMRLIFGQVEPAVMDACVTYLRISAYSYPALAIYNAGAALYRSFGRTSTTMYLSVAANILNVVGNCVGVFALHAGVAGVAWPSLIARSFSAVVITVLCFSRENPVRYLTSWIVRLDGALQRKILGIAVPNGVESGVFQLVKVALSSVVALFGTYQIAANGVAQTIWNMSSLVCMTMGPVFITVIGQCMGAGGHRSGGAVLQKADEDHARVLHPLERAVLRRDAGSALVLCAGGGDQAPDRSARADSQHIQRGGLPLCRPAGQGPARRGRRPLHDGHLPADDPRRAAGVLHAAGHHAPYGRHRHRDRHVYGLGHPRDDFHHETAEGEMEDSAGDLMKNQAV